MLDFLLTMSGFLLSLPFDFLGWIFTHGFWMTLFLLWISWISIIVIVAIFDIQVGVRTWFVDTMVKIFEASREMSVKDEISRFHRRESTKKLMDEEPMIDRQVIISSTGVKLHGYKLEDCNKEGQQHPFHLMDNIIFAKSGIEAIIEDEVTSRFEAEEIAAWNLLTRTNAEPEFISWKMTLVWVCGVILRYVILFPFRFQIFLVSLALNIFGNIIIGIAIPWKGPRKFVYRHLNKAAARTAMRSFSAVIRFHNKENRAKGGGICVANHTSPIDTFALGTDNVYALVGQLQGGLFGVIQRAYTKAESHVWFNRAETNDRLAVLNRLKEHVADKTKMPILIFPEGTCMNNTSVMMFKKGSFETGGTIYPAAIKYDPRFADAFWNSGKYSLFQYLMMMMTSWALVADITYLPPQTIQPGEDAVQFANRVKADIARAGGLVDLDWDGQLKRYKPKESLKVKAQKMYSNTIDLKEEDSNTIDLKED